VSRGLASNLMPRGSAPSKTTISHTSRKNQKIEETSYLSKKTYRSHGEDQLVERMTRTHQPVLLGIARRDLLVVPGVVAGLKGSCPRSAGELEGLGLTTRGALRHAPVPSSAS
jgi:hypothetical protein